MSQQDSTTHEDSDEEEDMFELEAELRGEKR